MNDGELLELIWSGAVEVRGADMMSPLARVLDALLVVPTVSLVSNGDCHRPIALTEGNELLPGTPLGDVLAEELGIHVPRDAIVLIEPVEMADTTEVSGAELGRELGNILMSMALMPLDAGVQHAGRVGATSASGQYSSRVAQYGLASSLRQRAASV